MEEKSIPEFAGSQESGLTAEKLRTFKGLENVTDDEADNIISSLKELARITIMYHNLNRTNNEI